MYICVLIQAGACFGLSAAACRTGFLLAEGAGSATWIVIGIAFSAILTSSGFVIQTRGLKDGNTVVVCTCAAVSSMVSGTESIVGPLLYQPCITDTEGLLYAYSRSQA